MNHSRLLISLLVILVSNCQAGRHITSVFFEAEPLVNLSSSGFYERSFLSTINTQGESEMHLLVSVNLETEINLCENIYLYPEEGKTIGYKLFLLPVPAKACNLKITIKSQTNHINLNKVYFGKLSELWIHQIKRDAALVLFGSFYFIFACISIFIFFYRFMEVRFLSLALLLLTAAGYSLSIGNGLLGLVFTNLNDAIWPHILFGSLYAFPTTLLYFLSMIIKTKWNTFFRYGALIMAVFWLVAEFSITMNWANYNNFLMSFHILCVIALLIYFPPAVRYLIEPKNQLWFILVGLSILLLLGFLEMIISYGTNSLEVPLLPFGIFFFLLSLGFWGVKSFHYLSRKYEHVTEIKDFRKTRNQNDHKSRIASLDEEKILKKLDTLMAEEKIYLQEDLNLSHLAKELGIRIDQLSFLINNRMGKPFSHYLNDFRIEEAKRLLERGDTNILRIAYTVGFQSKSAFNSAFKKNTQNTPSEYKIKIKSKHRID